MQALEAKIKVLETENQNLKRKMQNPSVLPPKSPFFLNKKPRKQLTLMISDSSDNFMELKPMNTSFVSTDNKNSKRFTMPKSPFLLSPMVNRRRPSSDELLDEQTYNNHRVPMKCNKTFFLLEKTLIF